MTAQLSVLLRGVPGRQLRMEGVSKNIRVIIIVVKTDAQRKPGREEFV